MKAAKVDAAAPVCMDVQPDHCPRPELAEGTEMDAQVTGRVSEAAGEGSKVLEQGTQAQEQELEAAGQPLP